MPPATSSREITLNIFERGLLGDIHITPPVELDETLVCSLAGGCDLELEGVVQSETRTTVRLNADDYTRNQLVRGADIDDRVAARYEEFAGIIIRLVKNQ